MKSALMISTFLLLLLQSSVFSQQDTIHIFPGKGIDNIFLFQSSQSDVKKYKGLHFTVEKGAAIADLAYFDAPSQKKRPSTRRNRWKNYYNDSLGLTFKFVTKWKNGERVPIFSKMRLQEITITKLGVTQNNIIINKSTRQDVIKSFGKLPDDWKNESYIFYKEIGIAFTFNEETKILISISVKKPIRPLINESW